MQVVCPTCSRTMRLFGFEPEPEQLDVDVLTFSCECGHVTAVTVGRLPGDDVRRLIEQSEIAEVDPHAPMRLGKIISEAVHQKRKRQKPA